MHFLLFLSLACYVFSQTGLSDRPTVRVSTTSKHNTTTTTITTTTTTTTTESTNTLDDSPCKLFSSKMCSLSSPSSLLAQVDHTPNEYECQKECQKVASCSHFSWLSYEASPAQCFLFKECLTQESCSECTIAVSGPNSPDYKDACCSTFVSKVCGLIQSNLLSAWVNMRTPADCQKLCRDGDKCSHFTHDLDTCLLFSACSTYEDCDSCVSGPPTPSMEICQKQTEDLILLVGGSDHAGYLADSELITPKFSCPSPLPSVPVATKGWSLNYISGHLLLCGGEDKDSVIAPADTRINRRCWTLSHLLANEWEETFSMQERRTFHATAVTAQQLWAFGGEVQDLTGRYQQVGSVESFTQAQGWTRRPELALLSPRSSACAVAFSESEIFLIGGFAAVEGNNSSSGPALATLDRLDLTNGTWIRLAPMLEPRFHLACSLHTFEGKQGIVASGGMGLTDRKPCDSVEFYDVDTNTWERMPKLENGRCGHSMSHINGALVVIGGHNNGTSIKSVEEFSGNDWKETINIGGKGRHYFAATDIPAELSKTFPACQP